jgi:ABC-type maltose transport system permease subunit
MYTLPSALPDNLPSFAILYNIAPVRPNTGFANAAMIQSESAVIDINAMNNEGILPLSLPEANRAFVFSAMIAFTDVVIPDFLLSAETGFALSFCFAIMNEFICR